MYVFLIILKTLLLTKCYIYKLWNKQILLLWSMYECDELKANKESPTIHTEEFYHLFEVYKRISSRTAFSFVRRHRPRRNQKEKHILNNDAKGTGYMRVHFITSFAADSN
jgi:hypothetical protein